MEVESTREALHKFGEFLLYVCLLGQTLLFGEIWHSFLIAEAQQMLVLWASLPRVQEWAKRCTKLPHHCDCQANIPSNCPTIWIFWCHQSHHCNHLVFATAIITELPMLTQQSAWKSWWWSQWGGAADRGATQCHQRQQQHNNRGSCPFIPTREEIRNTHV